MRSILNSVQTLYVQEAKELNKDNLVKVFECSDLFELMVNGNSPIENYKYIASNFSNNADDALLEISRSFVDFLAMNYPQYGNKVPYIIITIAEYLDQMTTSPDRLLVLLACCFKIQTIFNFILLL